MSYTLSDKWVLWAHLPHDTDWSIKSYFKIHEFDKLNDSILINNSLSDELISSCMLFLMKDGIKPIWEDENNINGGCFSFKVNNSDVPQIWKNLFYSIIGNTLSKKQNIIDNLCGITISPKKSFCIIKIWTKTCNYQNPQDFNIVSKLNMNSCIFKRHLN